MTHHIFEVSRRRCQEGLSLRTSPRRRAVASCSCAPSTRPASWPSSSPTPASPPSTCTATSRRPPRDRNLVAFSSGSARVLVATDIAARGIHVDDVELVVHVDPPAEHKAYLHRSGRTARAGRRRRRRHGHPARAAQETATLLRRAGINVKPLEVGAESEPVRALVGEVAPHQAPAVKHIPAVANSTQMRRHAGAGQRRGGRGRGNHGGQSATWSSAAART